MKPVFDRLADIAASVLLRAVENGKHTLTHHKVVKGRRSREWSVDADDLRTAFGDDIFTAAEPKLLTPAQAEKSFGKEKVANYAEWTEPGNKLAAMNSILDEVTFNCNEFDAVV